MSIEALFPFAGNHSIQSLAFVFEWANPLTPHQLQEAAKLAPSLKSHFPKVVPLQTMTFTLGPVPNMPQIPNDARGIGGIHFHGRPTPEGVPSQELQINPSNCVIIINQYTRWASVWDSVQSWLEVVFPEILPAHPVSSLGLQCTDLFHWRGNPELLVMREIFQESDYLPKHVFDRKSLWHSHHGFFEDISAPVPCRLLENVNVGWLENNKQRSISIQCVHKAELSEQVWDIAALKSIFGQILPGLHDRNKKILGSLLTKPVCEKIKLVV